MCTKKCAHCKEIKSEFYKNAARKDGYDHWCKDCRKTSSYAPSKQTPENKAKTNAKWNAKNTHYYLLRDREWRKNNPEASRSKVNSRRRSFKLATPNWLTDEQKAEIKELYEITQELQWINDPTDPLEVDHIVPLKGKNVCGLHVPWNLCVTPRSINRKKSNKVF